jgi:hypothetical protein
LPVACNARDPENLAGARLEGNLIERGAERFIRAHAQAVHNEARTTGCPARGALDIGELGADHHFGDMAGRLDPRVAFTDDATPAKNGGALAQGFDLVQLVADVKHGAAFVCELS